MPVRHAGRGSAGRQYLQLVIAANHRSRNFSFWFSLSLASFSLTGSLISFTRRVLRESGRENETQSDNYDPSLNNTITEP